MSGSGQARKKGGGPPTNSIDIVVDRRNRLPCLKLF